MRSANGRGEGQRPFCPVQVYVGRVRGVDGVGSGEGGFRCSVELEMGATVGLGQRQRGFGRRWIKGGELRRGVEGTRVSTHSATSVTEEVFVARPSDVYRKVGAQPAWSWGSVGSMLPSPGAKRCGGSTSRTRYRPRSGSVKIRPIRSVPSRVG